MKTETTAVIFRTFKDNGQTIALFPFIPSSGDGWQCLSYMQCGQHSGACPHIARDETRLATRKEILPLAKELKRIGYKLKTFKRFPRNAYSVRKQSIKNN